MDYDSLASGASRPCWHENKVGGGMQPQEGWVTPHSASTSMKTEMSHAIFIFYITGAEKILRKSLALSLSQIHNLPLLKSIFTIDTLSYDINLQKNAPCVANILIVSSKSSSLCSLPSLPPSQLNSLLAELAFLTMVFIRKLIHNTSAEE